MNSSGRITPYLRALKEKKGCTQQWLADVTDIPIGTIPAYFSGIDDKSANFEIVRKLVVAMDGSLDELAGIAPKKLEIDETKLTDEGFTEVERRAILRWAGMEISRAYQATIANLESRLKEKDAYIDEKNSRLTHRDSLVVEERMRSKEAIQEERKRANRAMIISYVALGLFVLLFFLDLLFANRGWILR